MGTDCTTDGLHITYLQDKAKALLSWLESEEVSNPKHPDHEIRVYRVWDLARDIEKDSREYRETLDESPPTPRGDTQSPRTPSQENLTMELKLGQFVTDTSGKTWVIDEIETDTDGEITYWGTDADGETQEVCLEILIA